jgi:hypothetical protein
LHETSYDSFVLDKWEIFRVTTEGVVNGNILKTPECFSGIGPEAANSIPEVETYTRIDFAFDYDGRTLSDVLIKTEQKEYVRGDKDIRNTTTT